MNIRIIVEDEGPGIPLSFRHKEYSTSFPWRSPWNPIAIKATGLGLGLAIAQGIVGAQGGRNLDPEDPPE